MKICPKCQQQYPNGFQYCPNDTELLIAQEDFNRRTRPVTAAPVVKPVEPPIAEVVPITNPFPREEPPRVPPSPNVTPTPREQQHREMPPVNRMPNAALGIRDPQPKESQAKDAPSGLPFRKTEPIAQNPPQNIPPQQNVPRPPAQSQSTPPQQSIPRPPAQSQSTPPQQSIPRPPAQSQNIPPQQSIPRTVQQSQNIPPQQNAPQPPAQPIIGNTQNTGVQNYTEQSTQPFQARQTTPQTPQHPRTGQSFSGQIPTGQPQMGQAGTTGSAQPRIPQPSVPTAPIRTSSVAPPMISSFSISLPDQGGFFARLIDSLKNIGDSFRGGGGDVGRRAPGDFQFLLPEESLSTRIGRELSNAGQEFSRDPKRFVVELARGEGNNRFRRNALLAGSEMALVGYVTLYFITQIVSSVKKVNSPSINLFFIGFAAYLGLCYLTRGFLLYKLINRVTGKFAAPKIVLEFANWVPIVALLLFLVFRPNFNLYCLIFPNKCIPPEEKEEDPLDLKAMLPPSENKPELQKAAVEKRKIGGSKPKPKPAAGGGGGGREQPAPPSKGVPPQMSLTPQIIPPNPEPPKIKNPTLVVASTIYGDPKAIPPMKGPIGDPTGIPAPPSSGPGKGAGIGRGAGTGVGGGEGGGLGPGRGGNTGGGNMAIGGGGSIEPMTASLRPKIIYQEKAKYTEEARQNKVQGSVMLSLIFTLDGRIENIRVVRGLPDGLTEKAIEAAKKIRFQPAVKNGQPVSVRGVLEFSFNLY